MKCNHCGTNVSLVLRDIEDCRIIKRNNAKLRSELEAAREEIKWLQSELKQLRRTE